MSYESDNDFYNKTYGKYNERFSRNRAIIENRQRAAAINLPGAEADVARAKVELAAVVNEFRHDAQRLETTLSSMADSNSTSVDAIRKQKEDIAALKQEVGDARTLNEIRKEQVETLRKKHNGDYHSSYLGLWVPLREHTRVSLLVVSVFFILLGIVATVFIRWTGNFPEKPINPTMGGFVAYSRRK